MRALVRNIGSNSLARIVNHCRDSGLTPTWHRISHSVSAGAPWRTRQSAWDSRAAQRHPPGGKTRAAILTGVHPTRLRIFSNLENCFRSSLSLVHTRYAVAVAVFGCRGLSDGGQARRAISDLPENRGGGA